MSWIGVLVVSAMLAMLGWQFWIVRQARRNEGRPAPGTGDGSVPAGKAIYYFHSQSCGACRGMTPQIEALAQRFPGVHKVDVQAEPDIAGRFNVRATPTTVLVRDGTIERVFLGPQSERKLVQWLEDAGH